MIKTGKFNAVLMLRRRTLEQVVGLPIVAQWPKYQELQERMFAEISDIKTSPKFEIVLYHPKCLKRVVVSG